MNKFFEVISGIAELTMESRQEMALCLHRSELPKGHLLVKQDAVCDYFYFIEQGLTRTFYYKDGKDVTDWISNENSFACSIISFITRQPDRRNIELLEPSVISGIHYDELEKLCKKHHDVEHLIRKIVCAGLIQVQQKFDDVHFETAVQRYQTLMNKNASLIQRVPLGMIASYLGITQETLSRIRSQV
ncbi:MAG: Crp/Fnr family transcriptional regulator [Bacteroidia bacterium]